MRQNANEWMSSLGVTVQQSYRLEVRRAGVLAKELSVISFEGSEELDQPSRFVIRLTHSLPDLPRASFLWCQRHFIREARSC